MGSLSRLLGARRLELLLPLAAAARRTGQRLYLTGGFLRDRHAGIRPKAELDLASADPGGLVAAAGRRIGGSPFLLDQERGTWRIALRPGAALQHIDLTRLRGATIAEDLGARDFTVNALAVDVTAGKGAAAVEDPLGGRADLERKMLRACSADSFSDDPLRVMRGYRLAAALSFRIDKHTLSLASKAAGLLPAISGERVRQELFALLQGPAPRQGMRAIVTPGLLAYLSPAFAAGLSPPLKLLQAAADLLGTFGRGSRIARRIEEPVEQDVTGRGLMLLGAFLRDRGVRTGTEVLAGRLRLGKKAASVLATVAAARLPVRWLRAPPSAGAAAMLDIHRTCPAFPELLLVEVAARLPRKSRKDAVVRLAARYGRAQRRFLAPPLLTGRKAMSAFGLRPGEALGALLRAAREAQDLGRFSDLQGALGWARRFLSEGREGPSRP